MYIYIYKIGQDGWMLSTAMDRPFLDRQCLQLELGGSDNYNIWSKHQRKLFPLIWFTENPLLTHHSGVSWESQFSLASSIVL